MSTTARPEYKDLIERARLRAQSIKAATQVPGTPPSLRNLPSDPSDAGKATAPEDPNASPDKRNVPGSQPQNSDANPAATPPMPETQPAGLGEGKPLPTPTDGNAKDKAFTSPTTDLAKIASSAAEIAARLTGRVAPTAPAAPEPKQAAASPETPAGLELTPDYHLKLATIILADEEGRGYVEQLLDRHIGHQARTELVKSAQEMQDKFAQVAYAQHAEQQELLKVAAQHETERLNFLTELGKLPEEQQIKVAGMIELINSAAQNLQGFELDSFIKGAMDMAALMDGGGMPEGGEVDPAAMAPGATPNLSPEELLALVDQLVQAGQIDPAQAEEIKALLSGGGGGGGEEEMAEADKQAAEILAKVAPLPDAATLEKVASAIR